MPSVVDCSIKHLDGIGVITNIEGDCLTKDDRQLLISPALCGLILFSRNAKSPAQLCELTAEIRRIRPELPLFVDQEGGRVQRFREGFTRLPPMAVLDKHVRTHSLNARQNANDLGWLMAAELGALGVDVSFAPVLDVERGVSNVIGDRAFSTDPARVAALAEAFITGMRRAGMKTVGKHFPGHGAVAADSHLELPVDERNLAQLDYDMRPFRQLVSANKLDGVMPAHVLYPAVDKTYTAGFSACWMSLLRQQVGFSGVVFSDDLSMEGAARYGTYQRRTELAVTAGCNALVVCNDRKGAWEVLASSEAFCGRGIQRLDLSGWCRPVAPLSREHAAVVERLTESGVLTASQ